MTPITKITKEPRLYIEDELRTCKECSKVSKLVQATFEVGGKRIDFCTEWCLKQHLMALRERLGIRNGKVE